MTDIAGPSNPNDPCWASALYPDGPFGDFGCEESPETCERGVGSHARSYDLAKLLLEAPILLKKITEAVQDVFSKY